MSAVRGCASLFLATLLVASPALANPPSPSERLRAVPCPGCLVALPPSNHPVPLLVLLHGDGERAAKVFAKWEPAASSRGIAVLALACPAAEGCSGSWWRWDGDSAWIEQQVRRFSPRRPIDPERLWLAGWSGGASYAGRHTQALEKNFSALVLHGGGLEPADATCPPAQARVYFLVGDRDPYHPLALALRYPYDACSQEVQWARIRGADHSANGRPSMLGSLAAIFGLVGGDEPA